MRENALFEIFRGLPALTSILVPWLSEMEFRTFYKKEEFFESFIRVLSMTTVGFRAHSLACVLYF